MRNRLMPLVFAAFIWGLAVDPVFSSSKKLHVRAELFSETASVQPGEPLWVGVRMKMEKGWHIFWKNPGDAGLATRVEWTLPEGFEAAAIEWPYPMKFGEPPVISYGYSDEVILLNRIDNDGGFKGKKMRVTADVSWLECAEICLPGKAKLSLELPVWKTDPETGHSEEFSKARSLLPEKNSGWSAEAAIVRSGIRMVLSPKEGETSDFSGMTFFPEEQWVIEASVPQKFSRRGKKYVLECAQPDDPVVPASLNGVLLLESAGGDGSPVRAIEMQIPLDVHR